MLFFVDKCKTIQKKYIREMKRCVLWKPLLENEINTNIRPIWNEICISCECVIYVRICLIIKLRLVNDNASITFLFCVFLWVCRSCVCRQTSHEPKLMCEWVSYQQSSLCSFWLTSPPFFDYQQCGSGSIQLMNSNANVTNWYTNIIKMIE